MDFQDLADNDGYLYMWSATGHLSDGGIENIQMPGFGDSEVLGFARRICETRQDSGAPIQQILPRESLKSV